MLASSTRQVEEPKCEWGEEAAVGGGLVKTIAPTSESGSTSARTSVGGRRANNSIASPHTTLALAISRILTLSQPPATS